MEMTGIGKCDMSNCAYNMSDMCHTLGITVGSHAECNTYTHRSEQGGFMEVEGGIGACMASDCSYNKSLECTASGVEISNHQRHADCQTYNPKKQ
jgi:hypothetical protein